MPKFVTADEAYRILQREQPLNVYPDGPATAFYATADNMAFAELVAAVYENLELIYDNYWPQTADSDALAKFEIKIFGRRLSALLSVEDRRDRVITRKRSRKGLTRTDILDIVYSIIGSDKTVRMIERVCHTGGWRIGSSKLSRETYLGRFNFLEATGSDLCSKTHTDFGMSEDDWLALRRQAYTYLILIYDYTLTTAELTELERELDTFERASARRVILDGLDSSVLSP